MSWNANMPTKHHVSLINNYMWCLVYTLPEPSCVIVIVTLTIASHFHKQSHVAAEALLIYLLSLKLINEE